MELNRIEQIMRNERLCMFARASTINSCNRDCANCDLLLPTNEILEAYDCVIKIIDNLKREQEFIKDMVKGGIVNG